MGSVGLLTSDAMVDGVHFRSGQIDWSDLGWKAVVSNQSDIAAMGGTPEHALVTLGVTGDVSTAQIEAVYRGMAAATNEFGGEIVGGDTVRSPVFFLSVALAGSAGVRVTGEPALLRRDAARVGDLVAVTGPSAVPPEDCGRWQKAVIHEPRNTSRPSISGRVPGCRRAGRWSMAASNVVST